MGFSPWPPGPRIALAWAAAIVALWALGWTVTTLGGIAVERQFSIFDAYGALTISTLSGLLLHQLLPECASSGAHHAQTQIGATS